MVETALTWNGIAIPPSDFLNDGIKALITAGQYEQEEMAGATEVITPEDRVIEMGAGLGIVGTAIGVHCRPKTLVAYEGNPLLIPHIEEIYALNDLGASHQINNMLLMADPNPPASVPFHVHRSFLGSSTIKSETHTARSVDIPTRAFEDLRREIDPTVLVMDIEGGEDIFLQHANLDGIRAIIIEFHPEYYGRVGTLRCKYRLWRAGFKPIKSVSTSTVWTCTRS